MDVGQRFFCAPCGVQFFYSGLRPEFIFLFKFNYMIFFLICKPQKKSAKHDFLDSILLSNIITVYITSIVIKL